MKYHQIKEKIDRVMKSCKNSGQKWVGYKYCKKLINRYLPSCCDNLDMQKYLIEKYM